MSRSATTSREELLARLREILACPQCRIPLPQSGGRALACPQCAATCDVRDGRYVFSEIPTDTVAEDWLNRAKESAKRRLKRFYPLAIDVISPVHGVNLVRPFLQSFDVESQVVADLGSGTTEYGDRVVCVDGVGYANVHVVADLERLPFQDGSLSGIVSVAVLEHVRDPSAHVSEFQRVLQPGGRVLCFVPFIQGFHASPQDFQRYTPAGLRELFRDFDILDVRVGAGPTSGLIWIAQEWLAMALSFGSLRLYRLLVPCMWLLSPLKYLDVLLARHPAASTIASGHYIEARKRG